MIDDKKIEEAAKQYAETAFVSEVWQACYKDGFIDGAKLIQRKFLKDLWHPIEEKPDKEKTFLYQTSYNGFGLNQISDIRDWNFIIKYHKATQWMYMDDLLPKKGGEE